MLDRNENEVGVPDLSIVIVSWNTSDELRKCLRSVCEADTVASEVIVVDNASSDDSVRMLRDDFPWVRRIENSYNLGFAKGSNQGIKISRGRYVMLLNPDSEVRPGAFSAIVQFGDENPEVGIFGAKVLNSDGTVQYSCRRFPTFVTGLFRNTILGKFFPQNPYIMDYLLAGWDHNETRDVDWVSGCAMILRRELLDDIGPFDERFFMYVEDVDIAYRAKEKGWRVAYFPGAVIVHARAKSSDKARDRMIVEFHKSMYRFFRKHYARKSSIVLWIIVPLGLIARASFFIGRNYYRWTRGKIASVLGRRHLKGRSGG